MTVYDYRLERREIFIAHLMIDGKVIDSHVHETDDEAIRHGEQWRERTRPTERHRLTEPWT